MLALCVMLYYVSPGSCLAIPPDTLATIDHANQVTALRYYELAVYIIFVNGLCNIAQWPEMACLSSPYLLKLFPFLLANLREAFLLLSGSLVPIALLLSTTCRCH